MSDHDLGPKPNFLQSGDYRSIWLGQTRQDQRTGREGRWSESGEDPDDLREMPYWSYLRTRHWKIVRKRALAAAEHRCFYCGATHPLDVHHLTYKRLGCELDEDLIVLCRECHDIEHQTEAEQEAQRRNSAERYARRAA